MKRSGDVRDVPRLYVNIALERDVDAQALNSGDEAPVFGRDLREAGGELFHLRAQGRALRPGCRGETARSPSSVVTVFSLGALSLFLF